LADEESNTVLGGNHMLTRAALKNPYAVFAICMIALLLGAVSYKKMRIDIFPEIKIPTIWSTFYRGLVQARWKGRSRCMEQRLSKRARRTYQSQSLAGMSIGVLPTRVRHDAAQSELTSLAYSIIRLLPPGVITVGL
jgi:multidrug efflux pump subunit AcrB